VRHTITFQTDQLVDLISAITRRLSAIDVLLCAIKGDDWLTKSYQGEASNLMGLRAKLTDALENGVHE
jgi:hypothetical protein